MSGKTNAQQALINEWTALQQEEEALDSKFFRGSGRKAAAWILSLVAASGFSIVPVYLFTTPKFTW